MTHKLYFFALLLSAMFMVSCGTEVPPEDNPGTDPGTTPGTDPGTTPGTTTEGFDVFQAAFSKKGNTFVYRFESMSSWVAYGKGKQTSNKAGCIMMTVTSVSGNSATVEEVNDFNFNHPSTITYTRGSQGELYMNGNQVTMTQSPKFWGMSFGMSDTHELKEYYSNGEYKNIYYTKSNGYTTATHSMDITETWNKYGMYGCLYSDIDNDASIGTYTKNISQVSAQTATEQYEYPGIADIQPVTLTAINGEMKSDGSAEIVISFTHNGTKNDTWGYYLGVFMNGEDGNPVCYPIYQLADGDNYFKDYYRGQYDPSEYTSNLLRFTLTPAGVQVGEKAGEMSFGVFAAGYGYLSNPSEMATMRFGSSASMPARITQCKAVTPAKKVDLTKRSFAELKRFER